MSACIFCDIIWGRAPATITYHDPSVIAILPLNPVVPGHELVIPKMHVADFTENHRVTADTMAVAALIARDRGPMNLITSRGREATQSVFHLHVHLVPRAEGDGLALPWHDGKSDRVEALAEHWASLGADWATSVAAEIRAALAGPARDYVSDAADQP